jgi:carbamoyltransferase
MTAILGISALYHDSAACLVRDGELVAAAQEERFTRIKHDSSFPVHAIRSCLAQAGIQPEDLTHVAFYEKPLLRFDRLMETYLRFAPVGVRSFYRATGALVNGKLSVGPQVDKALEHRYDGPIYYVRHHDSHAASAFLPSPFEEAAVVTADGVGEWATTSIGHGQGSRVDMLKEIRFPHSLGLLYSAFTGYLGFQVNSGEYKLMGLAPYGRPKYVDHILGHLMDLKADGSFWLDMRYFSYCQGLDMVNRRFCRLFGGPRRPSEAPFDQRHLDIAASIQAVTEEVMMKLARHAHELTGSESLCLAGGVALNCVANGRILREGPFKRLWIQPASGDAGGALGAALHTWHRILEQPRAANPEDSQKGSLLGPSFSDRDIETSLRDLGAVSVRLDSDDAACAVATDLLSEGRIIGWFQGPMEFGPRALCCRSILADPRPLDMQNRVNLNIKFREGFRPFAPVVLRQYIKEWFDLDVDSPYMLLVAQVAAQQMLDIREDEETLPMMERLWLRRSTIPAVTHVDGSARIQTCDEQRNPLMHRLLSTWHEKTGCPVLLNTSFNVRGEPIVCTPQDAYSTFMATGLDALVMGRNVLYKSDQPEFKGTRRTYRPD